MKESEEKFLILPQLEPSGKTEVANLIDDGTVTWTSDDERVTWTSNGEVSLCSFNSHPANYPAELRDAEGIDLSLQLPQKPRRK